jgi:hypothetical protein
LPPFRNGEDGNGRTEKAAIPARKKLIPGLESGPILIAPCSIEGVVDRDV